MLQVDVYVSELREFAKRLPKLREGIFPLMNLDLKATATKFLNDLLAAEFSLFIGREKYERDLVEISSRVFGNVHHQCTFAWRTRPISDNFKYLFLERTNFSMRVDGSVEKVALTQEC